MQTKLVLLTIGLCVLLSGCTVYENSFRNLWQQSIDRLDECSDDKRNMDLAEIGWHHLVENHPDKQYSSHYEQGFKCGFADYLDSGGNGNPPPGPPWKKVNIHYETPDGYQAIQEWYAGFRDGSAAARETGYRRFIEVPLSAPYYNPYDIRPSPRQDKGWEAKPAEPDLPMPKKLAPEDKPMPPADDDHPRPPAGAALPAGPASRGTVSEFFRNLFGQPQGASSTPEARVLHFAKEPAPVP